MRNTIHFFLILSLLFSTACATLTGAEKCALIGQIQTGTLIGTKSHISSFKDTIYSYDTPSYDSICKTPETDKERDLLAKTIPVAKEKQKQKNTERWLLYGSIIPIAALLVLLKDE